MSGHPDTTLSATGFRDAFDRSFAVAHESTGNQQAESLLAIRVAGHRCALRIREMNGLLDGRKIVALPGPGVDFMGLAGIRGELVAVYSLAAVIGYPREAGYPRWLALCGKENPVGFAFRDLEGYVQVPFGEIYSAARKNITLGHVREVAQSADTVRAIVSLPSALEAIAKRREQQKELGAGIPKARTENGGANPEPGSRRRDAGDRQ